MNKAHASAVDLSSHSYNPQKEKVLPKAPKNILNTFVVPSLRFIVALNPNIYFVTILKRAFENVSLDI